MNKTLMLITLPVTVCLGSFLNAVFAEPVSEARSAGPSESEKRLSSIDKKLSDLALELETLKQETTSDVGFERRLNAFERQLSLLELDLKDWKRDAANNKVSVALDKRGLEQEITHLRWLFTALGVVGLGGLVAVVLSTVRWAKGRMRQELDKAIYGVDPTHRAVHVPAEGFGSETGRLEWLGFRRILTYDELDSRCLSGLVVVRITEEGDVDRFREFLRTSSPERDKVGFVLYARTFMVPPEIIDDFENLTFANSAATLGNALFVLARGLRK